MIIIADSGATKTTWALINIKRRKTVLTSGINAQVLSADAVKNVIGSELIPEIGGVIPSQVFFYGAGCSSEQNILKIKSAFAEFLPDTEVIVNHDLLAAARALFGDQRGIACILGTGSNSGIYDGKGIMTNIPALGYILGDEGSGAYMGKLLLRDFLYNRIPEVLKMKFIDRYNLDKPGILNAVYQKSASNVFLASLMDFISENNENEYCYDLIRYSFNDFIKYHILPYDIHQILAVSFVGSVAFYNAEILKQVVSENELIFGKVLKVPIDELVKYHSK